MPLCSASNMIKSYSSHVFRGNAVVPFLLFLLLRESAAEQVCINISNSNIVINTTSATIVDNRLGKVKCTANGEPCFFSCSSSNKSLFDGSSACFNAEASTSSDKTEFRLNDRSCRLDLCIIPSILNLMHVLDLKSSKQSELMQLFYIRDTCAQLFSSSLEVKKSFVNIERNIIHNIMRTSEFETGGSKHYSMNVLSLNVFRISQANASFAGNSSRIQMEVPQLLPQNKSFVPDVWLPMNALHNISKDQRTIGLVSYMHHNQFQFEREDISSMVVRIELLGKQRLRDLETSIKMTFRLLPHTEADNDLSLRCHYFDELDWKWKTDGCETHNRTYNSQIDIICKCDHATPFAVLLIREPIAEAHWKILSYISYIGCGLSAFFTALSLVIHVYGRNHKMDYSMSLHVSLSGALFLLNSTFLLTEWGATVKLDWVCVFVAALMHYALLCCFTWMAIEALHLYLLLIKVYNTYYKHYLVKLSLAGWGIPGVIVAVSLAMKDFKQFYGVTQMTMADTNQTSSICWITDDSFFYSLNLVYFTLIFVFNFGILLAVASNICKMKRTFKSKSKLGAGAEGKTSGVPEQFRESCRSGITVTGLTCLLGTTWGLAFLGSGYINYPILYLFCILNSAQGFFIFLWVCVSARKQRKRAMEERITSAPLKTSGVKSD